MKKFIINNFTLVMLSGCIVGLFLPNPGTMVSTAIPVLLGTVIFSSMFKIKLDKQSLKRDFTKVAIYYVLRFVAVPVVLFYVVKPFSDFYSSALFLLALLPVAVSAPAFTDIFTGNTPLTITSVVFSNSITPFVVPLMCSIFLKSSHPIDSTQMFKTLAYTIILPIVLHFPFRKSPKIKSWLISNTSVIAVVCIAIMFSVAISKYKYEIAAHYQILPLYLAFSFTAYSLLYVIGWFIVPKAAKTDRISYAVGSGANNIGLGVALTILYFSAELNILFIISQIMWTLILFPVKRVARYIL